MRFTTFTLLVLTAVPTLFAKSITLAQLEREIVSAQAEQDASAAHRLSKLELKEPLERSRLVELEALLPGDQSRAALIMLADRAAFLPPGPESVSHDAAPTVDEQRRMIEASVAYVVNEIPRLPSFLAQKRTLRFEQPLMRGNSAQPYVGPLQLSSIRDEQVSYREGKEVLEPVSVDAAAGKPAPPDQGLHTWGEFGPILTVAMNDIIHNHLAWQSWELSKTGKLAVFEFDVPAKMSHYTVNYCCTRDAVGQPRPFQTLAGYRGKLVLDPKSGAILRLELRARLRPSDPVDTADLQVDYGAVEIGGRSFLCPVSSVAVFRVHSEMAPEPGMMMGARSHLVAGGQVNVEVSPEHTMINDASFREYHQFRGEVRIVSTAPPGTVTPGTAIAPGGVDAPVPAASLKAESSPAAEAVPAVSTAADHSALQQPPKTAEAAPRP